jgi:hypothetical protein
MLYKNSIYEGNLEELKKIPKIEIPKHLSAELEKNLHDIEYKISENINNNECKYSLIYFLNHKKKIESCISYLEKIK